MKLFNPQNANGYVFAVVAKNAREGTAATYVCVNGASLEACEASIDQKGQRNAYPYVVGRYDERGRYCVYKPAIEGVTPGRFVMHPLADEEFKASGWR